MTGYYQDELGKYRWPRPAADVRGHTRPWTVAEMVQLFRKGWTAGSKGSPMAEECKDLPPYVEGHTLGLDVYTRTMSDYCKRVGYKPTFLRTE